MSGQYTFYLLAAASFVAMVALIEGLYLLWRGLNIPGRNKTNRRLHELYASGVTREEAISLLRSDKLSDHPVLNVIYKSLPRLVALHRLIEQAGVNMSLTRFLALQLSLAVLFSSLLFALTRMDILFIAILSLPLGFLIPYLLLRIKRERRRDLFKLQLPEALDYIARSLRAGNPFMASIKLVSQEMPDPIASEFGITFDELNFGLEMDHALHGLHDRTQSEEIHYFVTAVLLQRSTGGNLAEVLNRISAIIRARATTHKEIKILSAEMKMSANVLFLLPFIVAAGIMFLNPDYMSSLLEHEAGYMVIGLQLFFMIMGYLVVQKMVRLRV